MPEASVLSPYLVQYSDQHPHQLVSFSDFCLAFIFSICKSYLTYVNCESIILIFYEINLKDLRFKDALIDLTTQPLPKHGGHDFPNLNNFRKKQRQNRSQSFVSIDLNREHLIDTFSADFTTCPAEQLFR